MTTLKIKIQNMLLECGGYKFVGGFSGILLGAVMIYVFAAAGVISSLGSSQSQDKHAVQCFSGGKLVVDEIIQGELTSDTRWHVGALITNEDGTRVLLPTTCMIVSD